jgi:hypothetical protein
MSVLLSYKYYIKSMRDGKLIRLLLISLRLSHLAFLLSHPAKEITFSLPLPRPLRLVCVCVCVISARLVSGVRWEVAHVSYVTESKVIKNLRESTAAEAFDETSSH